MNYAVQAAQELGCNKIKTGIVEENKVLKKWYESFGFLHTGTQKYDFFPFTDFFKNDEISLVLEKTVDGDAEKNWVPAYHFAICNNEGVKMGACDLRIGHNEQLYYGRNIGYRVHEEYRGHHYAGKACLLLFELARKHALEYLIITCNPDNYASRKTCEYAGGELVEIVELPEGNDMRENGELEKCIYRFSL